MADIKENHDVVFVLNSDKKKITAHRSDLSRASPYFTAMFTKRTRNRGISEIPLNDISVDVFQAIIDDCYFCDFKPNKEDVLTFLILAKKFQFTDILRKCNAFVVERLNQNNCLAILSLAEKHDLKELMKPAIDCFNGSFTEISQTGEFLELDNDRLQKLLASDDLNVCSEEVVYRGMINWVGYKPIERVGLVPSLMALIRLPHLETKFIAESVHQLAKSSRCEHLIDDALAYKTIPAERMAIAKRIRVDERHCSQKIIAVGREFKNEKKLFIELYCPARNTWTLLKTFDSELCRLAATITDDHRQLIIAGDSDADSPGMIVDLATMTELHLPATHKKRQQFALGYLNGCIYITGGVLHGYLYELANLDTVERYDPENGSWSYVASMAEERSNHAVAALNGLLYVAGGGVSCAPGSDTVECFDPDLNTWTSCSPMLRKRTNFNLTPFKGYLYAVGGSAHHCSKYAVAWWCNSIERYDPKTNEWTYISNYFATDRMFQNFEGAIFNGQNLYGIGAETGDEQGKSERDGEVRRYNLMTKEWTKLAPLNHIREDVRALTASHSLEYLPNLG